MKIQLVEGRDAAAILARADTVHEVIDFGRAQFLTGEL